MASPFEHLPENIRIQAEAYAFRTLIAHFQERPNVQNMETMTTAGFCRNCLSKWLMSGYRQLAPLPLDKPLTYDDVSNYVYGMSPKDWKKKYQLPATEENLRRYEESKKNHATHEKNVLDEIITIKKTATGKEENNEKYEPILDPCCPDSTEDISVSSKSCSSSSLFGQQKLSFAEPPQMDIQLKVLTVSDRAYNQIYKDESGPMIQKCFSDYTQLHSQVKVDVLNEKVCRYSHILNLFIFYICIFYIQLLLYNYYIKFFYPLS